MQMIIDIVNIVHKVQRGGGVSSESESEIFYSWRCKQHVNSIAQLEI